MNTVIRDNGQVLVGDKYITTSEARKILRLLRDKKTACKSKKEKIHNRIRIIERFLNEAKGENITLGQWMKSKGLNFKAFYSSLGYYTPLQAVVSNDNENKLLAYHRPMQFNKKAGFFVPKRKVVTVDHHNLLTHSNLGYTYDPALALYFPTTVYDTNAYASSLSSGDLAMDIAGGFTMSDLANLTANDEYGVELMEDVKELYQEEYDNVVGEEDAIDYHSAQILLGEEFYGADGKPLGNATCHAKCNFVRKSKRAQCFADCDKKFPPSSAQTERREERDVRIQAREDKRDTKKTLKEMYKAGEISLQDYLAGMKEARKEKRTTFREEGGGSFVGRMIKGSAKVFPLTLAGRSGAIVLIKNNAFGFATRLAPALLPVSQAKQMFKPTAIVKAKAGWTKVADAWEKLGGNPVALKEAILSGYAKKPMKVEKESSFEGYNKFKYQTYSNVEATTLVTAITTGLATLTSLIGIIMKAKVDKDPFINPPADFQNAQNDGTLDAPAPDPYAPAYDPKTGEWIDPSTGRAIDPETGEFKDNILGMNKWLAIGLGVVLVGGTIFMLTRKKGTGK